MLGYPTPVSIDQVEQPDTHHHAGQPSPAQRAGILGSDQQQRAAESLGVQEWPDSLDDQHQRKRNPETLHERVTPSVRWFMSRIGHRTSALPGNHHLFKGWGVCPTLVWTRLAWGSIVDQRAAHAPHHQCGGVGRELAGRKGLAPAVRTSRGLNDEACYCPAGSRKNRKKSESGWSTMTSSCPSDWR